MRIGQNPAKSIDHVAQPQRVTVAVVTYIPFLQGYYEQSLDVLKACLGSIWENTTYPHDLLVFDNGSCEPVRSYLAGAQSEGLIQYLVLSEKNMGKGGAWNFIFQGAPGEIIAYADSDILFRPGWLERSMEILETFPRVGMVTARPLRTPEKYYTNTLAWSRQDSAVETENGDFIEWDVYREHVMSLGTSEEEAREWFASRKDLRLTYQGVSALVSAGHFQFSAYKSVLQQFLPFDMSRPMGQVRSLDERVNEAGYLRLTTCEPLIKHIGNRIAGGAGEMGSRLQRQKPTLAAKLLNMPQIKRGLLRVYDSIFKLYYG